MLLTNIKSIKNETSKVRDYYYHILYVAKSVITVLYLKVVF